MSNKARVQRMMEETRQRLGFGREKSFQPTPNVRNPHMLEEAEAFSEQLSEFESNVRGYHRRVQGFLRRLLPLLDGHLPRVWEAVEGGLAEPVRPAMTHGHASGTIGGDYSGAAVVSHLDRLAHGIEGEVLAPLRRWQEGLAVARERMRSLERLRREADRARRTHERKFRRAERRLRRAYLGAGFGSESETSEEEEEEAAGRGRAFGGGFGRGRGPSPFDDSVVPRGKLLEDYQRLALHTERQLRAILDSYYDQERLVWEQLSGLVTDAAWLESYAAAAMVKVKEALQGIALALGPSKQPLPAYRVAPYLAAGAPAGAAEAAAEAPAAAAARYGEIGSNERLVALMSPRAQELVAGAAPRGVSPLPYTPLRAKRGTATPLLVAAAARSGTQQRMLAAEPVPPVALGASGVPLQELPAPMRERALRETEAAVAGEGVRVRDAPAVFEGAPPPPPPPRVGAGEAALLPTTAVTSTTAGTAPIGPAGGPATTAPDAALRPPSVAPPITPAAAAATSAGASAGVGRPRGEAASAPAPGVSVMAEGAGVARAAVTPVPFGQTGAEQAEQQAPLQGKVRLPPAAAVDEEEEEEERGEQARLQRQLEREAAVAGGAAAAGPQAPAAAAPLPAQREPGTGADDTIDTYWTPAKAPGANGGLAALGVGGVAAAAPEEVAGGEAEAFHDARSEMAASTRTSSFASVHEPSAAAAAAPGQAAAPWSPGQPVGQAASMTKAEQRLQVEQQQQQQQLAM